MKIWRSYDGIVTLGWLCVVAFVSSLREGSLSDDASMVQLAYGVMVVAVALGALVVYLERKMKRRAENKVGMSELILLTDIRILAKANSKLLDDAIALRWAQMEQGRGTGD